MQMASSGLQQAWLEDLDVDDPSTVKEWEMRRTTYRQGVRGGLRLRNQAPEAYAGVARHQGGPNLPEHV